MFLQHKLLRAGDVSSGNLIYLDLGPSKAEQRDHPAVPLQPTLDQFVLSRVGDSRHLLDLASRVPPPVHVV